MYVFEYVDSEDEGDENSMSGSIIDVKSEQSGEADQQNDGGSAINPTPVDEAAPTKKKGKKKKELIVSFERLLASMSRGLCQIIVQITIISTFMYALRTDVNTGIITSVFSTNLFFTIVYFYFVYGQSISYNDLGGTLLIVICIVLISVGGGGGSTEAKPKTEEQQA